MMCCVRCMQEEIFGPVVCIVPFDAEEEVVQRVNSTRLAIQRRRWCSLSTAPG